EAPREHPRPPPREPRLLFVERLARIGEEEMQRAALLPPLTKRQAEARDLPGRRRRLALDVRAGRVLFEAEGRGPNELGHQLGRALRIAAHGIEMKETFRRFDDRLFRHTSPLVPLGSPSLAPSPPEVGPTGTENGTFMLGPKSTPSQEYRGEDVIFLGFPRVAACRGARVGSEGTRSEGSRTGKCRIMCGYLIWSARS